MRLCLLPPHTGLAARRRHEGPGILKAHIKSRSAALCYVNDEHGLLISFWKNSEINSPVTGFGHQIEGIFPVRTDGLT